MQVNMARRSPRLVGYDYNEPGLYFVTLCTVDRESILGEVVEGDVQTSPAGRAVLAAWQNLPVRFPALDLDAFVIMPNHIHGIVMLGVDPHLPPESVPNLNRVIRAFKSISAIAANQILGRTDQPFWQRSYHDRIIRHEQELALIRAYIADNPSCWGLDIDNPAAPVPS